ncbi:MAG: AAA family ATPase [Candidatus Omnitrophica bacterium]|nr:AAA family ATPase [Candidatus Omnitrophota bacterium]MCK5260524.1 AAA family ATPase [Candidatus Omnitrophota bacterium]
MYKEFYNLKENPFNMTADPDFYFSSLHHKEAFSHLVYGIHQRKGILVVTGEIGTGKTTLCRTLLNHLGEDTKTALILNPNFSELQLLKLIIKDLGIPGNPKNRLELIEALNDFLLEETALGNNVVLIIDEAQNLTIKQLEHVRLLSNIETEKEKLLQIILVGQPELCDKLKLNELRQLNQRVAVRYHILPLEHHELAAYIKHRLKIANASRKLNQQLSFSDKAIDIIFKNSGGTPRMINILCDRALLAGYISETNTIDEHIIHKCTQEVVRK